MPDTDNWILKAIEREAMARALASLERYPSTFRFMGFAPEQLAEMVMHVLNKTPLNNSMSPEEIRSRLSFK